jgi:23S rRNA (pseudouridine1915-N3)-methyltransferase
VHSYGAYLHVSSRSSFTRIICVGKTRETWIKQGIEEYQKRLLPAWKIQWQELKDASLKEAGSMDKVKKMEATIIGRALSPTDYVIALDEIGREFDSPTFAIWLEELLTKREIAFVIGGVYGLDETIRSRADLVLSFSRFTFPHQLIRLLLIEQLYRAKTISSGKTYHY